MAHTVRGRGAGARAPATSGCQGYCVCLLCSTVSHGSGITGWCACGITLSSRWRPGPALSICLHPSGSPAFLSPSPGPREDVGVRGGGGEDGKAQNCTACAKFCHKRAPGSPRVWEVAQLQPQLEPNLEAWPLSLSVPWAGGLRKLVAGGGQCLCPAGRPERVADQLQPRD